MFTLSHAQDVCNTWSQALQDTGVSQNQGYNFGGPHNKDYSIRGSILGSPYFGKLPYSLCTLSMASGSGAWAVTSDSVGAFVAHPSDAARFHLSAVLAFPVHCGSLCQLAFRDVVLLYEVVPVDFLEGAWSLAASSAV